MGRIDFDRLFCLSVYPSAQKTTTREGHRVHFAFLDDGKFEVTAERSRVYLEPHATMSVAPQHGLH